MILKGSRKILFVLGTRPDAIKLAPLIKVFESEGGRFQIKVCVTGQHREMLWQVLNFFKINVDYDLDLMVENQSLFDVTARGLLAIEPVLRDFRPALIVVQGDTTTALVGALAGYYQQVDIAHVEAGLRSNQKYSPYPEEINRSIISKLADYHFAPTEKAKANLLSEGIRDNICVTGNTVVDALLMAKDMLAPDESEFLATFEKIDFKKKIILVTGHRRESFGKPLENICLALRDIASANKDCVVCYPVHLNPNIQEPVERLLSGVVNIFLMPPLDYPHFVFLMSKSFLVLTDSGGVQEEAPALGKPVLVTREVTERVEGLDAGTAKLVGTQQVEIVKAVTLLLKDKKKYREMSGACNPYGDGTACRQILGFLETVFGRVSK